MQFFQHSRQGRPPKPKRDVVRAVAQEEASPGTRDVRPSKEIQDLQSHIKEKEMGGAGGEEAKDKLRGLAAEEPGSLMDCTMASLGAEGDPCITVGQLCPLRAFHGPDRGAVDPLGGSGRHRR